MGSSSPRSADLKGVRIVGDWSRARPGDVLTLPWADGPCPGDPWLAHLLPHRDLNRALLERLAEAPPPQGTCLGLLLAAPRLDMGEVAARLRAAGVAGVAAMPGIARLAEGDGGALHQAGLGPALEAERLRAAAEAGLAAVAASWDGTVPEGPPPGPVISPVRPAGGRAWLRYEAGRAAGDAMALPQSP